MPDNSLNPTPSLSPHCWPEPSRPMKEVPSTTLDDHDIVLRGYEQLHHSHAVAPETKNATSTPCVAVPPIVHIATTALNKIPRERSGAASCFCRRAMALTARWDRRKWALVPPYERAAAGTIPVRVTMACIRRVAKHGIGSLPRGRTLLSPEEEEELGGWTVDGRSVRCLCLPCELRRSLPVIPMSLRS